MGNVDSGQCHKLTYDAPLMVCQATFRTAIFGCDWYFVGLVKEDLMSEEVGIEPVSQSPIAVVKDDQGLLFLGDPCEIQSFL